MIWDFFQWKNLRELTIRGSLHITQPQKAPWVIFCHGFTGQRMGPGYLFVKIARQLAEYGFSSLRFDFCGSGESDGSFYEMAVPTMKQDLYYVVNHLKDQFAPSKIILLGHSFGGMVAAMHAGDLGAEGLVLLSPLGDPKGLIHRRKDLLEAGTNHEGYYENGPHEMSVNFLETLRDLSPVDQFSTQFKGNLLLLQGDCDQSISVDESYQYKKSTENNNISCEYHIVNGADHNYSRVSHAKEVITTICTWAKEHFS